MITQMLHCPFCKGVDLVRHGKTPRGKQHMQRIESKHINLRTRIKRLVRRTICCSKTEEMHDIVMGLFINRYEFRVAAI